MNKIERIALVALLAVGVGATILALLTIDRVDARAGVVERHAESQVGAPDEEDGEGESSCWTDGTGPSGCPTPTPTPESLTKSLVVGTHYGMGAVRITDRLPDECQEAGRSVSVSWRAPDLLTGAMQDNPPIWNGLRLVVSGEDAWDLVGVPYLANSRASITVREVCIVPANGDQSARVVQPDPRIHPINVTGTATVSPACIALGHCHLEHAHQSHQHPVNHVHSDMVSRVEHKKLVDRVRALENLAHARGESD